ncbi:hypothetical protein BJY01DRAFT_241583 [Aspergillus pseudoustus]|uniref:DUF7702 domain-containing protein n=1 Tax=Aspergillus pseudoustus TaxID=1810923 RepID=A0ABR4IBZ1_9EURO
MTIEILEEKHDLAIAGLAIFSAIHIVQFVTRFIQERRYWHHSRCRSIGWCFTYSWWGMIGMWAQFRIASSVLMISYRDPPKPILIAETVLQGIGLSFLIFEVSLVLLRSGQSGRTGPGNSRHPTDLRFTLHFFRFPTIISIVLILVGRTIGIRACTIVGIVTFILAFALVWCVVLGMAVRSKKFLSATGYRAVLVILASLPFLTIRVVLFLLAEDDPRKYNGVIGGVKTVVGARVWVEIIAAMVMIVARTVAEPLWMALPETTLF